MSWPPTVRSRRRRSEKSSWGWSAAAAGATGCCRCSWSTAATNSTPWPTTSRKSPRRPAPSSVSPRRADSADCRAIRSSSGSGVEAVLIEDVPYFYPEQATASVEAGLHVYMAKPIAVDVPGCLMIEAAAKRATQKQRCFLVDYQLPHDPACIEVATRVREGGLGKLAHVASFGIAWQAWPDPPLGKNIESRLRDEIWLSDTRIERRHDRLLRYPHHRRHRVDLGPTAPQRLRTFARSAGPSRTATAPTPRR